MTQTAQLANECATLGRELMALWPAGERSIVWDEESGSGHEHPQEHRFEIATGYRDHTTYSLNYASGQMQVHVKRLDDHKLHERARFLDAAMAEDDWVELRQILRRVADQLRRLEALKVLNLELAWRDLIEALFYGEQLGEPPDTNPKLAPSPRALRAALQQVLEEAGRLVTFEWRDWEDGGVPAVQALAPMQALEATLAWPTAEESAAVQDSDNFYDAVLTWFDTQLTQHGLTLIALSPIDESQVFALVSSENLGDLETSLQKLCIDFVAAPDYFDRT